MFHFCPQCGLISSAEKEICPACDYALEPVPVNYLSISGNLFSSQEARNTFVREVIESGPNFQPELAQNRDMLLAEKNEVRQQRVQELLDEYKKNRPTHKCPVCSSQNLSKISNAGKIVKIAAIGVWGAGDLGKKWRCNSCGYKF